MGIQNCFEGQPVEGAAYSIFRLSYVIHKSYSFISIVPVLAMKTRIKRDYDEVIDPLRIVTESPRIEIIGGCRQQCAGDNHSES